MVELIFFASGIPNSRITFQLRQPDIEAANLFSSSTPISTIEVHKPKKTQWKIKLKLTAEFTMNTPVAFDETSCQRKLSQSVQNLKHRLHQISYTIY